MKCRMIDRCPVQISQYLGGIKRECVSQFCITVIKIPAKNDFKEGVYFDSQFQRFSPW